MSTNAYKLLRDLLPDAPLQVGTVIAYTGGVATIELAGGGLANARVTATNGQRVFFRDNAIEGSAPNLTVVEIEI